MIEVLVRYDRPHSIVHRDLRRKKGSLNPICLGVSRSAGYMQLKVEAASVQ